MQIRTCLSSESKRTTFRLCKKKPKVVDLARCADAFPHGEVADDVDGTEGKNDVPVDTTEIVNRVENVRGSDAWLMEAKEAFAARKSL